MILIYRPQTLVIVRHAESLWNKHAENGRSYLKGAPEELLGVPDHRTPLSEEGKRQAILTGQALAKEFGEFETVYYSPWLRTSQTAKIILDGFPARAQKRMSRRFFRNLFLTEQNFGDLDIGVGDPEEVEKAYKKFYRERESIGKFYARTPNGESWADICMRTHQFLDIIFRPNRHGQKLLIITHGVTKQTFRYHLERIEEEKLVELYQADKNKNCGASHYEWNSKFGSGGRYELKFWNKIFY